MADRSPPVGHTEHSVASMTLCLALCWCAEAVVVVVLGQTCSLHAPVPTSLPSAMLLWHCHPHHIVMQEAWPQRERSHS